MIAKTYLNGLKKSTILYANNENPYYTTVFFIIHKTFFIM